MKSLRNNAPFDLKVITINIPDGQINKYPPIKAGSKKNSLKGTSNDFWMVVSSDSENTFSFSIRMPFKIKRVVSNPELPTDSELNKEDNIVAYLVSLSASPNDPEENDDDDGDGSGDDEDMEVDNERRIPVA